MLKSVLWLYARNVATQQEVSNHLIRSLDYFLRWLSDQKQDGQPVAVAGKASHILSPS